MPISLSCYENAIVHLLSRDIDNIFQFFVPKKLLKSSVYCNYCCNKMMNVRCKKHINNEHQWKCLNMACSHYKTTRSIKDL